MKSLISETHSITPRRPAFDFSKSSLHWIKDDPIASNILNVIHPITPAPERWFCQTFREALPYIQDEKLKQAA
ncbi:MAG TPA: metal-dependent hydrolase, partial [Acinetobacter lwoffii]|nr:metal-dependent hydrolase [Acinetobacter lwoffii]